MHKRTRFISVTLGLALAVAACAKFETVQLAHPQPSGWVNLSNVAVLVNPSGPDLVIMAEGRQKLWTHAENGDVGTSYLPGFQIRAMTAGPDLELWAVGVDNKVYPVRYNSAGVVINNPLEESFDVVLGSEDIAVSLDGEYVYITTNNEVHQYDRDGNYVRFEQFPRSNAWSIGGSAQRVAIDSDTGYVYTLEPLIANWGGSPQTVFRYTRFTEDLNSPQITEVPINDGLSTLHDFEVAMGKPVWERGTGFGQTVLEFIDGFSVQHAKTAQYSSGMRAGSLSSAGVRMGIPGCGTRQGGVLWRARNNTETFMLEAHTLCATS